MLNPQTLNLTKPSCPRGPWIVHGPVRPTVRFVVLQVIDCGLYKRLTGGLGLRGCTRAGTYWGLPGNKGLHYVGTYVDYLRMFWGLCIGARWGMEMEMMATQATDMEIKLTTNSVLSHQPFALTNRYPNSPNLKTSKSLAYLPTTFRNGRSQVRSLGKQPKSLKSQAA